jgi:hypothetical protein
MFVNRDLYSPASYINRLNIRDDTGTRNGCIEVVRRLSSNTDKNCMSRLRSPLANIVTFIEIIGFNLSEIVPFDNSWSFKRYYIFYRSTHTHTHTHTGVINIYWVVTPRQMFYSSHISPQHNGACLIVVTQHTNVQSIVTYVALSVFKIYFNFRLSHRYFWKSRTSQRDNILRINSKERKSTVLFLFCSSRTSRQLGF